MIYCRNFCPMILIFLLGILLIGCGEEDVSIDTVLPTVF